MVTECVSALLFTWNGTQAKMYRKSQRHQRWDVSARKRHSFNQTVVQTVVP